MTMNEDTTKGGLTELKGKAKQMWSKLTDNDFTEFQGNLDELKGKVQKLYGYTKEQIENEFEAFKQKGASAVNGKLADANSSLGRTNEQAEAKAEASKKH